MTELDKNVAAATAAGMSYGKYMLAKGIYLAPSLVPKPEPIPEYNPPTYTNWTDEMIERLIEMKQSGRKIKDIANALNVTDTAVSNKLHKLYKLSRENKLEQPQPVSEPEPGIATE